MISRFVPNSNCRATCARADGIVVARQNNTATRWTFSPTFKFGRITSPTSSLIGTSSFRGVAADSAFGSRGRSHGRNRASSGHFHLPRDGGEGRGDLGSTVCPRRGGLGSPVGLACVQSGVGRRFWALGTVLFGRSSWGGRVAGDDQADDFGWRRAKVRRRLRQTPIRMVRAWRCAACHEVSAMLGLYVATDRATRWPLAKSP